jgi:hypothetical protein
MNAGLVMKLTPIECMDFGPENCCYCSGQPTAPSMHVFNLRNKKVHRSRMSTSVVILLLQPNYLIT